MISDIPPTANQIRQWLQQIFEDPEDDSHEKSFRNLKGAVSADKVTNILRSVSDSKRITMNQFIKNTIEIELLYAVRNYNWSVRDQAGIATVQISDGQQGIDQFVDNRLTLQEQEEEAYNLSEEIPSNNHPSAI